MTAILLNNAMETSLTLVGDEQIPVLVIDQLITEPHQLINLATSANNNGQGYQQQTTDHYPGIRKAAPESYIKQITQLLPIFIDAFSLDPSTTAQIVMSAFSIATTPEKKLRPIQMLPHFDTPANNQYAMVHYLCDQQHGGTALYRHKASCFERITPNRLADYRVQIKQQAIAEKLHENPHYISGDNRLFSQIHSVSAQMNRAVIYPSNALHSGNINPAAGLSEDPNKGRLTISSFICLR